jgi:3-hydroxyacyl-CoA dehydrogenase
MAFDLALRACVVTHFSNPAPVGMLVEAAKASKRQKEASNAIHEAMKSKGDELKSKLAGALRSL